MSALRKEKDMFHIPHPQITFLRFLFIFPTLFPPTPLGRDVQIHSSLLQSPQSEGGKPAGWRESILPAGGARNFCLCHGVSPVNLEQEHSSPRPNLFYLRYFEHSLLQKSHAIHTCLYSKLQKHIQYSNYNTQEK